ncbi:cystatin domain-containing protein [Sphingomonas canadensis]|uniref:Cystatin domain-containing protein n=1 Tax=Sphingomonas canadensis TaxID=1219257 RepID=A0ABW3H449_9SPHN|nr:cystatin domain-containing protein [Sphingomonas canadensis]MCW3834630.1 cystatin domain-containing protein [Sphingomonas canadensis]
MKLLGVAAALALGIGGTTVSACAAAQEAPMPVVGGWSAVAADDAGVRAAADAVLAQTGRTGVTITAIADAQQQVVAGMNYRFALTLSDGSRLRVQVYRNLSGNYEITASEQIEPQAMVPGGWGAADAADPEVKAAADFALAQLNRPGATIAAIGNPRQQVVAGMNYGFVLTLSDGTRWDVTVYARFDGTKQLTAAKQVKD